MARGFRRRPPQRTGGLTTELIELSRLAEQDPRPPRGPESPPPAAEREPTWAAEPPARPDVPPAAEREPPWAPPPRTRPSAREDPEEGATVDMPTIDVPDWEDPPSRRGAPPRRPAVPTDPPRPAVPSGRAESLPRQPESTPRRPEPPPIPFRHRPFAVELAPGIEPPAGLLVEPTPDLDPATGTLTPAERESRRTAARERRESRPPQTFAAWRVRLADWLLLLAGITLLVALFLPWSHQFSASILARYRQSPVLAGVPRDPDAWQVYSIVDGVFAVLAGATVATAFAGARRARLVLAGFVAIALLFTLHAIAHAPTNGANIVNSATDPPTYLHDAARSGTGEQVALVALIGILAGVGMSVIVIPRRRSP